MHQYTSREIQNIKSWFTRHSNLKKIRKEQDGRSQIDKLTPSTAYVQQRLNTDLISTHCRISQITVKH